MKKRVLDPLQAFTDRLQLLAPKERYSEIYTSLENERPTTIRVNRLKTTREILASILTSEQISFEAVPWYPDAFVISETPLKRITELAAYNEGFFYVQSLSSMIPVLVMDPRSNDKILDIAAAPGSKTTQLASIMKNTGEIVANDNSQIRIYKLAANLAKQGVTNTHAHRGAGQTIWQLYPEYFDKVLADVPCSMEGRIKLNDPDTYKDWSQKKVRELAQIQKFLLRAAVSSAKPGGIIVYSTCTLSSEENEGVIDWLLKKESGRVELIDIDIPQLESNPGFTGCGEKIYDPQLTKAMRIWPSATMEGFFVAKIRKLDHTVPEVARNHSTLEWAIK